MAVINPPAWLQQGSYPARTDRLVMSSLIRSSGVVSNTDLVVTQSTTPGMSVTVSAGSAWILGTNVTYQGAYNFVNDSPVVLNVNESDTSHGRRDIVVARIQDAAVSGSVNSATLEVIAGIPASSPTVPATPANSIRLAVLTVNANASSITNSNIDRSSVPVAFTHRQLTSDVVVVTSTTRPGSSDRFVGMQILETDTQRRWMWNGSVWAYQGGGRAPSAAMYSDTPTNRAASANAQIYWMSKNAVQFDNDYFTFGNGGSGNSGDYIQVTQSGTYLVVVYLQAVQSGPGFWNLVWPRIDGATSGLLVPGQGTQVYTNGQSYLTVTQQVYINAGGRLRISYANSVVVNVRQVGLIVTMVP